MKALLFQSTPVLEPNKNPPLTIQQTISLPLSSLILDSMSYRDPAQEKPTSSSSQLPVPATRQHIATQKCSKPSKMLRRPIGKDQILEWQASLVSALLVMCSRLSCGTMPHAKSSCHIRSSFGLSPHMEYATRHTPL